MSVLQEPPPHPSMQVQSPVVALHVLVLAVTQLQVSVQLSPHIPSGHTVKEQNEKLYSNKYYRNLITWDPLSKQHGPRSSLIRVYTVCQSAYDFVINKFKDKSRLSFQTVFDILFKDTSNCRSIMSKNVKKMFNEKDVIKFDYYNFKNRYEVLKIMSG